MFKREIQLNEEFLTSDMCRELNSKQFNVLIVCLFLANHCTKEYTIRGKKYVCKSGQFILTQKKICEYCSEDVTIESVKSAIKKLKKWGFLTQQPLDEFLSNTSANCPCNTNVISISNWENYVNMQSNAIDLFPKSSLKLHDKTIKDKKMINFDIFWDEYHKITGKNKTDKVAAIKYWKRLNEKEKKLAIKQIANYANSIKNLQFTKKARTYLAEKNFNDEFSNALAKPKKQVKDMNLLDQAEYYAKHYGVNRQEFLAYPEDIINQIKLGKIKQVIKQNSDPATPIS